LLVKFFKGGLNILQKDSLTPNQKNTLRVIKKIIKEKGYPPTVREIGKLVGVTSSATPHKYLTILEKKGYIERKKGRSRAIKLIPQTKKIPVVGSVAAGGPLWALKDITEYIPIPEELSGSEDSFMIKVEGDSMIGDHILNGDYVMVKPQQDASNGDIVITLLNQEGVTVKRFYKKDKQITLQPSNPLYKPIISKDVIILGKVIGILRRFNGGGK
jgi:repressor LexA